MTARDIGTKGTLAADIVLQGSNQLLKKNGNRGGMTLVGQISGAAGNNLQIDLENGGSGAPYIFAGGNPNSYLGDTVTTSTGGLGFIQLNQEHAFGEGSNLFVAGNVQIDISADTFDGIEDRIYDGTTVTLERTSDATPEFGVLNLLDDVDETVAGLVLDNIAQAFGTYGAPGSGAENEVADFFTGTGILTVAPFSTGAAVPEPASIAIWSLLGSALCAFGYARRRRKK